MVGKMGSREASARDVCFRSCPRCQGYVAGDHWEIAPYACWNCGERYTEALEPVRRPPTALEMSRKYRQSYEASQSRR